MTEPTNHTLLRMRNDLIHNFDLNILKKASNIY